MPKLLLPVPETLESVTRPVVYEITRDIFKATGLPEDTLIYYPGDLEKTYQQGSAVSPQTDGVKLPFTSQVTVEVEEMYETERILSTAVMRPENLFIFRDDRIETGIKPAYSPTDVTITFRYRALDKTAATRWRDDIRMRVSMMRDLRLHNVSYHYLIPEEFLVILKEIHRLREVQGGYGEDYDTYFKANLTQRASILTNLAGKQPSWGISETQMRIVGWFDIPDNVPELGSKEDDGDTWTVSFSYKFKYDKPAECVMFYPLMIHNQLITYRPSESIDTPELHQRSYSMSAKNFSQFEAGHNLAPMLVRDGLSIPDFDEFIPGAVIPKTQRIFTALTSITPEDTRSLMNLGELGTWDWDDDVLAFLKTEAPYMTRTYMSIFCLSLYKNEALLSDRLVQVNSALDVTATQALSIRDYFHVRLSLVTDLSLLSADAKERLRNNGGVFLKLVDALDSNLKNTDCWPRILSGNYISRADFECVVDCLNPVTISQGNRQVYQHSTVMTLFIDAHRSNK
jgi:hypothetical protein